MNIATTNLTKKLLELNQLNRNCARARSSKLLHTRHDTVRFRSFPCIVFAPRLFDPLWSFATCDTQRTLLQSELSLLQMELSLLCYVTELHTPVKYYLWYTAAHTQYLLVIILRIFVSLSFNALLEPFVFVWECTYIPHLLFERTRVLTYISWM